jgi:glycosyltransferase involved in cell wall biosynthesis
VDSTSHRPRISAVLNTLNEASRLPNSLGSVRPWVDEIVVVDMHSDDNTAEIAAEFGARVFLHERLGFADPARAWAVDQSTGSWVLILDADEMVPAGLARRLLEITREDQDEVVVIPLANYLLGKRFEHTGWGSGQDFHPRFFRRASVELSGNIHGYMRIKDGARVRHLPPGAGLEIVHFNYLDVADFLTRLNRYTSIEASQRLRDGRTSSPSRGLVDAVREFARRYVRQQGYKDGWRGWYLSAFMATYHLAVSAKVVEASRGASRGDVEGRYRVIAREVLDSYAAWPMPAVTEDAAKERE